MITVYGISNCSTVRNARKYLEKKSLEFTFRDLRKEPLSKKEWDALVRLDEEKRLVNTKSQTFKKLGISEEDLSSIAKQVVILNENPSAMKRPLLVSKGKILAYGFKEEEYKSALKEL